MKINRKNAIKLSSIFNIDHDVVPFIEWKKAIEIELEHGKKFGKITNITNNDLFKTSQIAIAHLLEDPRYYYYLEEMEKKRKKHWKKYKKPSIFQKI